MGRKNRNARQQKRKQRKTMRTMMAQLECVRQGIPAVNQAEGRHDESVPQASNVADNVVDSVAKNAAVVTPLGTAKEGMNVKQESVNKVLDQQIGMDEIVVEDKPSVVEQSIHPVPLAKIRTENYQRVLNMKNVNKIVKEFNPAKLGVLVVSKRSDGTYSVLDGQHRLTALRRLGYEATNCIVLEGMSVQEEADYFRRQNENKQNLRIADTFNASLYAEDEESLEIKSLMDKYGFRFGKSGYPMCICAIGALQTIIRTYNIQTLENVLRSIACTWAADTTILRREMLAGLAEFWFRFADEVTHDRFEQRMATRAPAAMYQELTMRTKGRTSPTQAFNKNNRFACCGVLVDNYNRKLRADSPNRLNLEWSDGR